MASTRSPILLPPGTSPLNPLRWINTIASDATVRWTVVGLTAVLLFGGGWLIRLAARPKTPQAALGAAAAVGLITVLTTFAFFGPMFATLGAVMRFTALHPISNPDEVRPGRPDLAYPGTTIPQVDGEYLSQYLTDAGRAAPDRTRGPIIESLHQAAVRTNRMHNGLAIGWLVLGFVLVSGFVWSVHGTWAADYAVRSGRGPVARVAVYLELYLPVLVLTAWTLLVIGMTIILSIATVTGGPTWAGRLIPLAGAITLVGLAHTGVMRRWRWWVRAGCYLLCLFVMGGTVVLSEY